MGYHFSQYHLHYRLLYFLVFTNIEIPILVTFSITSDINWNSWYSVFCILRHQIKIYQIQNTLFSAVSVYFLSLSDVANSPNVIQWVLVFGCRYWWGWLLYQYLSFILHILGKDKLTSLYFLFWLTLLLIILLIVFLYFLYMSATTILARSLKDHQASPASSLRKFFPSIIHPPPR